MNSSSDTSEQILIGWESSLCSLSDKRVMFLRPRKFGKTLFTSTIEYYYDIKQKEKFNSLFENTYIGKNQTKLKPS